MFCVEAACVYNVYNRLISHKYNPTDDDERESTETSRKSLTCVIKGRTNASTHLKDDCGLAQLLQCVYKMEQIVLFKLYEEKEENLLWHHPLYQ